MRAYKALTYLWVILFWSFVFGVSLGLIGFVLSAYTEWGEALMLTVAMANGWIMLGPLTDWTMEKVVPFLELDLWNRQ